MIHEMDHVFADGIGGAMIEGCMGVGLVGRQNVKKAAGEMVELIGLRNVPVQRSRVELGQQVNTPQAGINAVGDWDVDEAIFPGERDGGFGAFFGEREEAWALGVAPDSRRRRGGVYRFAAR